jgi:hypothetical protein
MKNPNTFKIAGLALFAALNLSSVSSVRANASTNLEVQDEVAPAQFEVAPTFEEVNLAFDTLFQ